MTKPILGCIADDFTGATDLATMLVQNGMRTVQVVFVPGPNDPAPEADALIVALKSRTARVAEAVADSRAALAWLRRAGCTQFFFKYCSTFDSTDDGNIGPVADALLEDLGAGFALACPAFPANGRSVYQGHLFVGAQLLNESGMQDHPLTPMTDPNLVRVLSRQTDGTVGLVAYPTVVQGAQAVRKAMIGLKEQGRRYAIIDAVTNDDLVAIGEAAANHPLITGGSGIAMGLPENFRRAGLLPIRTDAGTLPEVDGHAAVLAGSCSRATLFQIAKARDQMPTLELDPLSTPDSGALAAEALAWITGKLGPTPILIAASAPPDKVAALQARLGRAEAGAMIEAAMAEIAEALVARGVRRLIVAGGETAGAVVQRLGISHLRIGAAIDPGVPWTYAEGSGPALRLALKSGNFGAPDFFTRAFQEA